MSISQLNKALYTKKQGQYLAFIFYYTKINGVPPAQADIQRYFNVSSATIHQMILQLEKKNLIVRTPNTSRSISIAVPESQLPLLQSISSDQN